MKRIFLLMLPLLLICSTAAQASDDYNGDRTVYVTATGECYHRRSCSYARAGEAITLQEAVDAGYRRCSRCRPLRLKGEPPVRTVITQDKPGVTAKTESDWISYLPAILFALVVFTPGVIAAVLSIRETDQQREDAFVRRYLRSARGKKYRDEYFHVGFQAGVEKERAKQEARIQAEKKAEAQRIVLLLDWRKRSLYWRWYLVECVIPLLEHEFPGKNIPLLDDDITTCVSFEKQFGSARTRTFILLWKQLLLRKESQQQG